MIKQIIKAIRALQEQQKIQHQINVLIDNTKSENVKIIIPKKYISVLKVFMEYGLTEPETIINFLNQLNNKSK